MVLTTKERPLGEVVEFVDNKTKGVDIDRDNLLRRIALLFHFSITTGAAAGLTIIEGDLLNAVKQIFLVMDADDNKFSINLEKWLFVEHVEKGTIPKRDTFAIPGVGVTSTFDILVNADFAQARQNLSDVSSLLDAPNKASLKLKVEWGTITDVIVTANNTSIDSNTEVRISLTEVFDDEGAEATAKLAAQTFNDIREGEDEFLVTKAFGQFDSATLQEQINPVPANILTHLLITKEDVTSVTGTPVRANDIVTDYKIQNIKGNGQIFKQASWNASHFGDKSEYGLESIFTGVKYIDHIDEQRGGFPNFVAEANKWRFLTNAPVAAETDAIQLYTRYIAGIAQ